MKPLALLLALPLALVAAAPASAAPAVASSAVDSVDAHSSDFWTLKLRADVTYTITVVGDGDTDLDGYLRDENGNSIDSDTDLTDVLVLSVTPRWSGPFTLEIRNLGAVFNRYVLQVVP
jgi:hypothetical protein